MGARGQSSREDRGYTRDAGPRGPVAQLVEQGTFRARGNPWFPREPLLRSSCGLAHRGLRSGKARLRPPSAPETRLLYSMRGPVAQLAEQGTFNPKVAGSIPARPTLRLRHAEPVSFLAFQQRACAERVQTGIVSINTGSEVPQC